MIVSINHINFSISRNFFFESTNDLNIFIYVHVIDVFTISIIVRNDKNVSIKISRNFRLKRIFEIDFSNAFYIFNDENVRHLIVKSIKFIHRNDWFKKLIFVCATTYIVVVTIHFDVTTNSIIISLTMSFLKKFSITTSIILFEIRKFFVTSIIFVQFFIVENCIVQWNYHS